MSSRRYFDSFDLWRAYTVFDSSVHTHLTSAVALHQTRTLVPAFNRRCSRHQEKGPVKIQLGRLLCNTPWPATTHAICMYAKIADAAIGPHHTCRNPLQLAMGPGSIYNCNRLPCAARISSRLLTGGGKIAKRLRLLFPRWVPQVYCSILFLEFFQRRSSHRLHVDRFWSLVWILHRR